VIRVVLDTNVLISAVLFGGRPRKILEKAIRGEIRIFVSEAILEELKGVLERPKFGYSPERVYGLLIELIGIAELVNPSKKVRVIQEDPDDNRILECAIEAGANYVITGDFHLLKLGGYQNIEILNPVDFLEKIMKDNE